MDHRIDRKTKSDIDLDSLTSEGLVHAERFVSGDCSAEELASRVLAIRKTPKWDFNLSDLRSLAVSLEIVAELERDPDRVLAKALDNIRRWQAQRAYDGYGPHPHHQTWETLIGDGPAAVRAVLTAQDQHSRQLRSSSPFAGVLPEDVRLAALRQVPTSLGRPT